MTTSFFDAGRLVGRVVAARSDAIVIVLTCAGSMSTARLSRSSSGFLLICSITVAATFAITGERDVLTITFCFSRSSTRPKLITSGAGCERRRRRRGR